MNVHWSAVFVGWLVDFSLSLIIELILVGIGANSYFTDPRITDPLHLILLVVFLAFTGVGGFVAARIARDNYLLNGFMVGITGILINTLLGGGVAPVPRVFVFGQAIGCGIGALGGWLAYLMRQKWRRR